MADKTGYDRNLIEADGTPVPLSFADSGTGAYIGRTTLNADAVTGALKSIEITLSGTPGTVTTVTIPDTAQGIRLYPRSNGIRFAIGEDPAAVGTSSNTTIAASAFTVGGVAKADQWETRILAAGTSRTVRIRSITASVVIDMEVF